MCVCVCVCACLCVHVYMREWGREGERMWSIYPSLHTWEWGEVMGGMVMGRGAGIFVSRMVGLIAVNLIFFVWFHVNIPPFISLL